MSITHVVPVARLDVQRHQCLGVTHLGVRLGGVGVLLQLLQVEGALAERLPLSLVQLPRHVYQPETQSLQALFVFVYRV